MSTKKTSVRGWGSCRGRWLDVKAVFTPCPWGGGGGMCPNCSGTGFKKVGEECAWTSRLEGASESNTFTWPPPPPPPPTTTTLRPPSDTRVHEHTQTHVFPVSPDAPASGVSSVSHVTGWRCDSCPHARPSLAKVNTHNTHTHTHTHLQTLHGGAPLRGWYGGGKGTLSTFSAQL